MQVTRGIDELMALAGTELGETEPVVVGQEAIDGFNQAGDRRAAHVEHAAQGSLGTTITHGYLALSLVPVLLKQLLMIEGFSHGVNYGLDKVRFPVPLLAGSPVRATARVVEVARIKGGVQPKLRVDVRAEGADEPCCVAEVIYRYLL